MFFFKFQIAIAPITNCSDANQMDGEIYVFGFSLLFVLLFDSFFSDELIQSRIGLLL